MPEVFEMLDNLVRAGKVRYYGVSVERVDEALVAIEYPNVQFDQGETFSGVDYATGLQAVEELRALVPIDASMAQFALRWILMFDTVTTAIPGAKTPDQMRANAAAAELAPLDAATMAQAIYDRLIRPLVHERW